MAPCQVFVLVLMEVIGAEEMAWFPAETHSRFVGARSPVLQPEAPLHEKREP